MESQHEESPQTLWQLAKMLAHEVVRAWLRKIRVVIVVAFVVWIVHTYLLVGPNGGFEPGTNWLYDSVLALHGRLISGTMFWALLFGLLTSLYVRLQEESPRTVLRDAKDALKWVRGLYREFGARARVYVLLGCAAGLLLGTIIDNRLVSLELSLLAGGSLLAEYGSVVALAVRLGWSDAQRLLHRGQPVRPISPPLAEVLIAGATLGFFAALVLPRLDIVGYAGTAALLIAAWLIGRPRVQGGPSAPGNTSTTAMLVVSISVVLVGLLARRALGDDGGWDEAGGDLVDWLRSGGAVSAVLHGIPAALGAAVGFGLGLSAGHLPGQRQRRSRGEEHPEPLECPIYHGGIDDSPFTVFDRPVGQCRCERSGLPDYWVNTATLNLVVRHTVLAYKGLGPMVSLTHTYNSVCQVGGMFGTGWRFQYESTVQRTGDMLYLWKGSGQRVDYRPRTDSPDADPDHPVEAAGVRAGTDHLLDYGSHWQYFEKSTRMTYRYEKLPEPEGSARLTSVSDLHGNTLTVSYGEDGVMSRIVDAAGRAIAFERNSDRLCTTIALPDGRSAGYEYDESGHLVRATNLLGTTITYNYDSDHLLTRMTVGDDSHGTDFTYAGTEQGKVIASVVAPDRSATRYEPASMDPREVKLIDPEGGVTTLYSTGGLTDRIVDPLGNTSETTFSGGLPIVLRNRNGHERHIDYDDRGNVTRFTDELGNSTVLAYDADDLLVSETDPVGGRTEYEYDSRHNLIRTTYPTGRSINLEYDSKGQVSSTANGDGTRATFEHDRFGNLTAVIGPTGGALRVSYDPHGLTPASFADSRGNVTEYRYDANGRPTRAKHPDGTAVEHRYDCCAVISTVNENGDEMTYLRDAKMEIKALTSPSGSSIAFDYDRDGRLVGLTDPLGHRTAFVYDAAGRAVSVTDPAGNAVHGDYDPEGNMIHLRDRRGALTTFAYDARSLPTQTTDPLGHVVKYERDAMGRLTAIANARGGRVSFTYDGDGNRTGVSHDGTVMAAYEYDSRGNLTRVTDPTGVTIYEHDAADQVVRTCYPDGLEASFSYDEGGNLSSVTYPDGLVTRYTYDSRERVEGVDWGTGAISYRYDGVGNLVEEKRSNGTESLIRYDVDRRIVQVRHSRDEVAFVDMTYTRDAAGNITDESGTLPIEPAIGGASIGATYNAANQIITRGSDTYTYDPDGNLTGISSGWKAEYDPENRLVELTRDDTATRYAYDGSNHRVQIVRGSLTRNVHHDWMGRPLFETNESGVITARYVHAIGFLAARIDAARDTRFYHFDETGSTLAMTDSRGDVVAAYAYDPHGSIVSTFGDVQDNEFTYLGAFWVTDEGGGLFFIRRRYYDAVTGRFIQRASIGTGVVTNPYAYTAGNPVMDIDPEGMQGTGVGTLASAIRVAMTPSLHNVAAYGRSVGEANAMSRAGLPDARGLAAIMPGGERTAWVLPCRAQVRFTSGGNAWNASVLECGDTPMTN